MKYARELRMTVISPRTQHVCTFVGDCTVSVGTDAGNHVYLDGVGESYQLIFGVDNEFVLRCPEAMRLFVDADELPVNLDSDCILLPGQVVSVMQGNTTITFDILP